MTFRDGSVQDSKKREPSNPKFLRSTALGSREVDWDPTPRVSRNRSPKSPEGTITVCWKNVDILLIFIAFLWPFGFPYKKRKAYLTE